MAATEQQTNNPDSTTAKPPDEAGAIHLILEYNHRARHDRLIGFVKGEDSYPYPSKRQRMLMLREGAEEVMYQVPWKVLGVRIPWNRTVGNRGGRLTINGSVVVRQSRWRKWTSRAAHSRY